MGCKPSKIQDTLEKAPAGGTQEAENAKQEALIGIRAQLVRHHVVQNIFEVFKKNKILGEGMSGAVYEVAKLTEPDHFYALKEMKKRGLQRDLVDDFRKEIQLLIEMDHPNVIKLYDTYEDSKSFFLCMEECIGGELFDHLSVQKDFRFSETYSAQLVTQMLRSIHYLHTKGICHRDLKLENYVFDTMSSDAQLKLIDFGLSCRYSKGMNRMKSLVGTPYYMAPEVLNQQKYDLSCDLWSLGVITYMLVSGIPPFNGSSQGAIMEKAKKGEYSFYDKYFSNLSDNVKDFISKLLRLVPSERMTAADALQHPWIKRLGEHGPMSSEVVKDFLEYKEFSRLKKTVLEVITFNMNIQEIKDLRAAFVAMDQDGNGTISFSEMKQVLSKMGLTAKQTEEVYRSMDTNQSGLISYSEFISASILKKVAQNEDRWLDAFHRMDVDGNGYLDKNDFRTLLGEQFNDEEVSKMIESADVSKDGKIDLDEFLMMMREAETIK